ncbi:MAG: sulfotransferase domain-containing protein, partial [Kiloniellales bacterium]|nr:sulfotransferase domain-containing protein [Kiloniellales bacterium]
APGFLESCKGPLREKWDRLRFYNPGYNFGYDQFIKGNETVFSPHINPDVRIVYLFRNPLDQIVSFYRHIQHHGKGSTREFIDAKGNAIAFESLSHFLRAGALESYIKQYVTYRFLPRPAATRVLMFPYEDLVENPKRSFQRMMLHLETGPEPQGYREAFGKALNATTAESLKNLERSIGATLGRDQTRKNESHLRGGEIGKWREFLEQGDLDYAEEMLSSFGLSLSDFQTLPT